MVTCPVNQERALSLNVIQNELATTSAKQNCDENKYFLLKLIGNLRSSQKLI